MTCTTPGNHLVDLGDDECLRLLAGGTIARISLTAGALPIVLPVNYTLSGRDALMATDPGLKLDSARAGHVACLEVDDWDGFSHTGWYVTATGLLSAIADPLEIEDLRRLPLRPWRHLEDAHLIKMRIDLVSGRRLQGGSGHGSPPLGPEPAGGREESHVDRRRRPTAAPAD